MDILATATKGALPVPRDIKEELLKPFVAAVTSTFTEMTGIEVFPRGYYHKTAATTLGEVSAALRLSGTEATLLFDFPKGTVLGLAERVLGNVPEAAESDESLRYDCLGEIANVVAGQAKALLSETPYHFTFSTPTVVIEPGQEIWPKPGRGCLIVVFGSELGEFALQLLLK